MRICGGICPLSFPSSLAYERGEKREKIRRW